MITFNFQGLEKEDGVYSEKAVMCGMSIRSRVTI